MDKYTLPVCTPVFSDRVEIPKLYEAVLPEYLPNIVRVLKTESIASVDNSQYSDGLLKMQVSLLVRVVYISEQKGYIKTATFPFKFEHSFDASRIQPSADAYFTSESRACAIASSAKVKGARSVEIKVNTMLSTNNYNCSEVELLSPEGNTDAEFRFNTVQVSKHSKISDRPEKIYEDISLDSELPAIAEVTDYTCKIVLDSINTADSCVTYNASAILKCTYRTESNPLETDAEYVYLTKEIPIRGEIVSDAVMSQDAVTGCILLTDIDIGTSFDPYGENRIINACIGYEVMFDVISTDRTVYADDGYCISYQCDFQKETYRYDLMCGKVNDKTEITERIPSERVHFTQITDSGMNLHVTGTEIAEGKLYAVGKSGAWIMGIDEKGEPACLQTAFNVRVPVESVKEPNPERKYLLNMQVMSNDAVLRDGEITVSATVNTDGIVLESGRIEAIKQADVIYDLPKPLCRSEYIVYYPEPGESTWDIAKKYEISVKEFSQANSISDNNLSGMKTVIIPCGN